MDAPLARSHTTHTFTASRSAAILCDGALHGSCVTKPYVFLCDETLRS